MLPCQGPPAAGGGGGSRGFLQISACSRPAWPRQGTARNRRSRQLAGGLELGGGGWSPTEAQAWLGPCSSPGCPGLGKGRGRGRGGCFRWNSRCGVGQSRGPCWWGSCRGGAGGDFVAQLWGAPARVQLALSLGRSRAEAGGERRPPSGFPVSGRPRGELGPGSLAATFSCFPGWRDF